MGKEFGSFRKATFGGFNRKDVIAYIEKMRNESFEYKKQVEDTVKSLNEKIRELENAAGLMEKSDYCENTDAEKAVTPENCNDIGQATKHLKTVADELCRSLGDFMDKLSERGLFDTSSQDASAESEDEIMQDNEISFVDVILSSISYLDENKASAEKAVEKSEAAKETDVSEILSGFSFLNR